MGKPALILSSELLRAARALLRWEQRDLATASSVSLPTIKRLEIDAWHYGCAFVDHNCPTESARRRRDRIHRRERWRPGHPVAKAATEKGLTAIGSHAADSPRERPNLICNLIFQVVFSAAKGQWPAPADLEKRSRE